MDLIWDGSPQATWTLILAHGAGASLHSEYMQYFAQRLAHQGIQVGRFNFPYMKKTIETERRRPPDRAPKLLDAWQEIIERVRERISAQGSDQRLAIGGKSMGGRIASMSTHHDGVDALVCLGYPFHPPAKKDKLRIEHLSDIKVPTMILQGERDTFGTREEVRGYQLPRKINMRWLNDGDHSFKPRQRSGVTQTENWDTAIESISGFLNGL
jgi:predicted alpha/beta-hydrolase family hydrolase